MIKYCKVAKLTKFAFRNTFSLYSDNTSEISLVLTFNIKKFDSFSAQSIMELFSFEGKNPNVGT